MFCGSSITQYLEYNFICVYIIYIMNAEVPKPAPTIEDAIPITTTLQNAASSVGESISNLIPGTTTTEEKKDEEEPVLAEEAPAEAPEEADLGVDTSIESMGVGPSVESALAPVEDTFANVVSTSTSTSSSTGTKKRGKKGKMCKCPTKKQKGSKKKYPRCKRGRRSPKTKKCKGAKKCPKGSKKDPATGACKPK